MDQKELLEVFDEAKFASAQAGPAAGICSDCAAANKDKKEPCCCFLGPCKYEGCRKTTCGHQGGRSCHYCKTVYCGDHELKGATAPSPAGWLCKECSHDKETTKKLASDARKQLLELVGGMSGITYSS